MPECNIRALPFAVLYNLMSVIKPDPVFMAAFYLYFFAFGVRMVFDLLISGMADGPTRVSHVIHQDGHSVLHVPYQHHPVHLVSFFALFVNESELHVQPVSDGGHPEYTFTGVLGANK